MVYFIKCQMHFGSCESTHVKKARVDRILYTFFMLMRNIHDLLEHVKP